MPAEKQVAIRTVGINYFQRIFFRNISKVGTMNRIGQCINNNLLTD